MRSGLDVGEGSGGGAGPVARDGRMRTSGCGSTEAGARSTTGTGEAKVMVAGGDQTCDAQSPAAPAIDAAAGW